MWKWLTLIFVVIVPIAGALIWMGFQFDQQTKRLEGNAGDNWSKASAAYQHRADLTTHLLAAVSTTPIFDRSATDNLVHAQEEVEALGPSTAKAPTDAAQLQSYDQKEAALTKAIFRVIAVPALHSEVKVSTQFRDLSSQLMAGQIEIAEVRSRFISSTKAYNYSIEHAPGYFYAPILGFKARPYFLPDPSGDSGIAAHPPDDLTTLQKPPEIRHVFRPGQ